MGIVIENRSGVGVKIWDSYVWDPATEADYAGVKVYSIAGGGKLRINSSVFTEETKNHMYPQRICVLREDCGEKPELILFHDEFNDNDGCHLLLEIVETHLTYTFVPHKVVGGGGGGPNLLQKFWNIILPPMTCG